jgi:hypothetical protein
MFKFIKAILSAGFIIRIKSINRPLSLECEVGRVRAKGVLERLSIEIVVIIPPSFKSYCPPHPRWGFKEFCF